MYFLFLQTQQCVICLENVTLPYGLLENCVHVFCATCILSWIESNTANACPTCRATTDYVLFWPSVPDTIEKEQLFALQERVVNCCKVKLDALFDTPVSVQ